MSASNIREAVLIAAFVAAMAPAEAQAQGLSLEISAGRVVYDAVSATTGTNNVMGTLRFDAVSGLWVYGTAATPLRSGDPAWGAVGLGRRWTPVELGHQGATIGVDLGGHGFLFRDAVVDDTGSGATLETLPFLNVPVGRADVEVRGGWRGHTLAQAGITERRSVLETGARASYGSAVRVRGDARWVHADESTYPFLGGTVLTSGGPLQTWVQTGKWLSTELDDVSWGAGLQMAIGRQATLWASLQQDAPDPLYWNMARRSWNVGMTRRLGGPLPRAGLTSAPSPIVGGIVVRVPAADVPGGAVSIAGDFNNWQAVPMQRVGGEWVARLTLGPGVYRYAFRSGDGEWFVPASVAGRRSDGMGGFVAVVVVN